jgi:hypothetical protein
MPPQFDDRDAALLAERQARFDQQSGPRVGDIVLMRDGSMRRFTHDWGDGLQTTTPQFGAGSFYFGTGHMDYSGALDPTIPKAGLIDTGEQREARVWFFHHNFPGAARAVHTTARVRVFRQA